MFGVAPPLDAKGADAVTLRTPLDGSAALVHVVPLDVSTFPEVPGATVRGAEVPLPSKTLFAVSVAAPVPPFATGSAPVTPVVSGSPVALVSTAADGVPSAGVTNVGESANTAAPVPVSSVSAARRFADDGVAKNVAMPDANNDGEASMPVNVTCFVTPPSTTGNDDAPSTLAATGSSEIFTFAIRNSP